MKCNRREFFAKSAAGLASVGLAASVNAKASADSGMKGDKPSKGDKSSKPEMATRPLGKTGVTVPIVSMGVMNARDPALIRNAYESGIRHFDTAAAYGDGRNEEMLGSVIRELRARDRVTVATKVMVPQLRMGLPARQAEERLVRMAEDSLKHLKMERVDILYLHDVSAPDDIHQPGIREGFSKLKKDGKIRFAGFSTHQNMAACLDAAVQSRFYEVILTTFNYALAEDRVLTGSMARASEQGIALVAMKTQCGQYWYKNSQPDGMRKFYEGDIVNSAVLKWVLRRPFISTAVPGVTTYQQIQEDVAAGVNLEYAPEESRFLKERNVQAGLGVCRQCGRCLSTCPKGVRIPELMRTHMYAACYANFEAARKSLDSARRGGGLASCAHCVACSASCSHAIPIRDRIGDLRTLFT
jgi:uncharacterized protein